MQYYKVVTPIFLKYKYKLLKNAKSVWRNDQHTVGTLSAYKPRMMGKGSFYESEKKKQMKKQFVFLQSKYILKQVDFQTT